MSKRSWLCLIRSLFFLETNHNKQHHKKTNRRRWLFGRFRKNNKGPFPTLEPPPPLPPSCPPLVEKPKLEVEAEQSKSEESKSLSTVTNENQSLSLNHHHENLDIVVAAIKIQTFYRGYLARKALKALKGFVRLQAIIRGRAVRRQAMTTLKCLEAIVNIQSEVCTRRSEMIQHYGHNTCFHHHHLRNDIPKVESNTRTRLDDGLLTKEDEIDILLKKKEAILRRNRSKAYSFNHRHSADSENGNVEGRLKYWLEQYVTDEALKNGKKFDVKQLKLKNNMENLSNHKTIYVPRRSFHKLRKQNSYIEDGLIPCSPTSVPTYMAATESTKAKTRSTSSPRLRPIHFEAYSDGDSPYKHKFISPMSSTNSDLTCLSKLSGKSFSSLHQKSPSFKEVPYVVK